MASDHDIPAWILPLAFTGVTLAVVKSAQAGKALRVAIPGDPPEFSGLPFLIARDAGLFQNRDVTVDILPTKSGAAATRAVLAGKLDLALVPTQFAVQLIANSQAPLKALWGLNRADWLLATMNAAQASCTAIAGKPIGVDSKRGPRWTQLNTILTRGCKLKIERDVETVFLGSKIAASMTAGKIELGLLHLSEAKEIELATGRPVHVIATLEAALPGLHHMMLVARKSTVATKREHIVRLLAALHDASKKIYDRSNLPALADMAQPIMPTAKAAQETIRALSQMSFFPKSDAGLDRVRIEAAIKNQMRIGRFTKGRSGIKPGMTTLRAEDVVDLTAWHDARRLPEARHQK